MKKILITLVVGCAAVCRAGYVDEVTADAPEAMYRFNESAGATTLTDASGNGHDSLSVSNVTFGATGPVDSAAVFSNGLVELDLQIDPSAGDFSVETLIRFDADGNVLQQLDGTGTGRAMLYRLSDGTIGSYLGGENIASSTLIATGEWHHVVMTVEEAGTNDVISFYIDGQSAGSGTADVEAADGNWRIGKGNLIGAIDELAVYTNLLSAEQVVRHYETIKTRVAITNAPDTVEWTTTTASISGTSSAPVVGSLTWVNESNGAYGEQPVSGIFFEIASVPLTYGTNLVTVTGTNAWGTTASDSVEIVRDMGPELTLEITSSIENVMYDESACVITGTNSDAVVGIITWTNDGIGADGSISVTGTTFQIADIPLAVGGNVILISGTNIVGDVVLDSITVTRDDSLPKHYVSPDGTSVYPYTNWVTAANNIQDAVDAASTGDTVLVADGLYQYGSYGVDGYEARVLLAKTMTLRSVNGPYKTFIMGQGPNGDSAARCVVIRGGNPVLSGFCLLNGHTPTSGLDAQKSGGGLFMSASGFVTNCLLTLNQAALYGGAVFASSGKIVDCVFEDNSAGERGGAIYTPRSSGLITDCEINNNSASYGGGVYLGFFWTMENCLVKENHASSGGGIYNCGYVNNCSILNNTSSGNAGGIALPTGGSSTIYYVNNCIINGNSASSNGGGVWVGNNFIILNNSTITGNSATLGGGVYCYKAGQANNTIITDNSSTTEGDNWYNYGTGMSYENCCTTPEVGSACVTNPPLFVSESDFHLQAGSPCIDAGMEISTVKTDADNMERPLDGNNDRSAATDIGAYEYFNESADSDDDGLTDGFEMHTLGSSLTSTNTDGDVFSDYQEYVADTDPTDVSDWFHVTSISNNTSVFFKSSADRCYTLQCCTNLIDGSWQDVEGQTGIMGNGALDFLTDPVAKPSSFYRVKVELP